MASALPTPRPIRFRPHEFRFGERTLMMGILNVTPDSFSDGGKFVDTEGAIEHALTMEREGADIIDVGGESTRPRAMPVSEGEEIDRVEPVIRELARKLRIPISIDTYRARTAERALAQGASVVNDVTALRGDPDMAALLVETGAPVIMMHMLGEPRVMQENPSYGDVVADVARFFEERLEWAAKAGIDLERTILDPGIGFGKTVEHNLEILRRLGEFKRLGRPILVGHSRKSFIGQLSGVESAGERLTGTLAAGTAAIAAGADILRVHDVRAGVEAARIADAIYRRPQR